MILINRKTKTECKNSVIANWNNTAEITVVTKKSSIEELNDIKKSDFIKDETGKEGIVTHIEILNRRRERQYYFKLGNEGTILVII